MSRADLHFAMVIDRELYEASQVDPTLLDPIVRVEGGLPGVARPIAVVRDYQGPQGHYTEYFVLRDRSGRVLATSAERVVQLSGEMDENRFVDYLDGILFENGAEHGAVFYINDDEVGSIPVFIESGLGGDPDVAARETFAKALQKGAVLWLTVPTPKGKPHTQPVWYVFEGGKVYVFTGPTEQQVPGLPDATRVEITARSKDLRSAVSRVPATVARIPADDERFDRIVRAGLGRRLNLPDGDGAAERWKQQCVLVELTPQFESEAAA